MNETAKEIVASDLALEAAAIRFATEADRVQVALARVTNGDHSRAALRLLRLAVSSCKIATHEALEAVRGLEEPGK